MHDTREKKNKTKIEMGSLAMVGNTYYTARLCLAGPAGVMRAAKSQYIFFFDENGDDNIFLYFQFVQRTQNQLWLWWLPHTWHFRTV